MQRLSITYRRKTIAILSSPAMKSEDHSLQTGSGLLAATFRHSIRPNGRLYFVVRPRIPTALLRDHAGLVKALSSTMRTTAWTTERRTGCVCLEVGIMRMAE